MSPALARLARLLDRRTAPPTILRLRYRLEYAALRAYAFLISSFPIHANLATGRLIGDAWWLLSPRHRRLALEHLRASFGDRYDEPALRRIARGSFRHFAQLYLVEMIQTPRLIHEWSWARYVELGDIGPALRLLLGDRGAIMLTGHFGNYELLGYTIARLGIPLVAVMRPLDNPWINSYLMDSREAGGLSLLMKKGASASAGEILDNRGVLCFIADQNAGKKGIFVDFFGRKASTYKSIGLLAMQHRVPILAGFAARQSRGFRYRIEVERIIRPEEWESRHDPLHWITQTYTAAIEAAVRRHPEQYLWIHRRWKTRPRDEPAPHAPVESLPPTA